MGRSIFVKGARHRRKRDSAQDRSLQGPLSGRFGRKSWNVSIEKLAMSDCPGWLLCEGSDFPAGRAWIERLHPKPIGPFPARAGIVSAWLKSR